MIKTEIKFFLKKKKKKKKKIRRSRRTDEVERINGFRRCLELYVADLNYVIVKGKGGDIFKTDTEVWKKRPLAEVLLQYCVVDTKAMFSLYDKMKNVNGGDLERLRVASERYVDLYRGRATRYYDRYETHAYLQLDIIPDEGTLDFAPATTACSLCHRMFPREEFSATQLRTGEQKCRVCKEIQSWRR